MNNTIAEQSLINCLEELENIKLLIEVLGPTTRVISYLTKYAAIRACGTIEQSFKTIIADYSTQNQTLQIKNYVDTTFRNNSCNPNYDNICKYLDQFDEVWHKSFKDQLNSNPNSPKIKSSLKSLNQIRNEFAHGGNPTSSFNDIFNYYLDSREIIYLLDKIVV